MGNKIIIINSSFNWLLLALHISAKPKVSMKPSGAKPTSPAKQVLKRKASECHPIAIAAVKPLSPIPNTKELLSENTTAVRIHGARFPLKLYDSIRPF